MANNLQLYRMDDTGTVAGMIPIKRNEAKHWNKQNYGVFHAVQEFHSDIRRLDNLKRVRCWAIDLDGNKEAQIQKINKSPLNPSMIVESKNGFHLYWFAKDATVENYRAIVETRLIYFFKADKNAKDLCRVLRTPYFYHCKNPNEKFLVKLITRKKNLLYREIEMLTFFKPERKPIFIATKEQKEIKGNSFWEKASSINCQDGLERLSGSGYVNGEIFTFRNHNNGTKQICVNGKSSSCWIDADGLIGSYDRGGPSIACWLAWYGHSWRKVAEILKNIFHLGE